jgi:hypothetical protein
MIVQAGVFTGIAIEHGGCIFRVQELREGEWQTVTIPSMLRIFDPDVTAVHVVNEIHAAVMHARTTLANAPLRRASDAPDSEHAALRANYAAQTDAAINDNRRYWNADTKEWESTKT